MVDRASAYASPGFLPVYSVATEQERDDLIRAAVAAGVLLRQGPSQLVSAHLAGEQTLPRLYAFGRQLQALHAGLLGREPEPDRYQGPTPPVPPERGWFCPVCDEFDTDSDLEQVYGVDPLDDECPRCQEPMDRVTVRYCDPDEGCPDPDEHHHGIDGHLIPADE